MQRGSFPKNCLPRPLCKCSLSSYINPVRFTTYLRLVEEEHDRVYGVIGFLDTREYDTTKEELEHSHRYTCCKFLNRYCFFRVISSRIKYSIEIFRIRELEFGFKEREIGNKSRVAKFKLKLQLHVHTHAHLERSVATTHHNTIQ